MQIDMPPPSPPPAAFLPSLASFASLASSITDASDDVDLQRRQVAGSGGGHKKSRRPRFATTATIFGTLVLFAVAALADDVVDWGATTADSGSPSHLPTCKLYKQCEKIDFFLYEWG
jgi:hypothetical protein